MRPSAPRLLATGLLAAITVAATLPGAIAYPEREYVETVTIPAGGSWELDLVLERADDWITYAWTTSGAPVEWDLHTHVDGRVTTVARGEGSSQARDTYVASAPGTYSFFFESPSADVSLHLELSGPFKVAGEPDPAPEANGTPAPSVALLALAALSGALVARRGRQG